MIISGGYKQDSSELRDELQTEELETESTAEFIKLRERKVARVDHIST